MDFLSSVNWAELGLKALAAIVILVVTAILAMVVKGAVATLAQRIPALEKPGVDGAGLGASIGAIASMIVWLLGLIMVLGIFLLLQVLSPVVVMLESALGYVPNIIGTVFVFIIGLTIAKIARALIRTALSAVDFGKLLGTAQSGIDRATGGATAAQHPACAEAASQPGAHHPGVAQPAQPGHGQPAPGPGPQTPVDVVHDTLKAADFDALVLPVGTLNVDSLRGDETAQFLTRAFAADGKPVAATCQAPWLLVETGLADGRELTSVPTIRTDLVDAGGRWVDQEVVVDDSAGFRLIPPHPRRSRGNQRRYHRRPHSRSPRRTP